jgi:hypothetical protein
MRRPAGSFRAHNGFEITDLKLLNETAVIQLTAGTSAPMTMQVMAAVKIVEVKLSDRFEVAQLILRPESSRFRAFLTPEASRQSGAEFETIRARLDSSAYLDELVLQLVPDA